MKIITLTIFLITITTAAQLGTDAPWMQNIAVEKSTGELTFKQIKEAGEQYWSTHNQSAKGSGYKPFLRWLERSKPYLKADGTIQSPEEVQAALQTFQLAKTIPAPSPTDHSNWNPVGPFHYENSTSWSPGQGRINTITVDPNNSNTYYVGAPSGGLWKSTNGGQDWKPQTDFLSQIGVSAIAVDPSNSNTVYIGTGDDDAGDSASIGVLKSTDGGENFSTTAITFHGPSANISEVYVDPSNTNTLYVASNQGFYKSTNGGLTAKKTFNGNVKDIKLMPGDSNTIYLATTSSFLISKNGGESFNAVSSGLPAGISRMVIGVTKADFSRVYILAVGVENLLLGLYQSNDAGVTFTKKDNGTDIIETTQAWYNLALEVSQTNADVIYTGCLNVWKSMDSGASFEQVNSWDAPESTTYTHADIHQIREFNGEVFVLSDGGVYRSSNDAESFTDLTGGLQIGQFYRIAVGSKSSANIAGGLQDNGGYSRNNNTWKNFHGADGMEAGIDPNDSNLRYSFTQFGGGLFITEDGNSLTRRINGPSKGNWITPLKTTSTGAIYAGYKKLYKVEGESFIPVSSSFNSNIDVLEIDPINEAIMYVGVDNQLFRSTDSGKEFTWIKELPGDITAIEVNNNNNNIVYFATGTVTGKVLRSDNMGADLIDITSNLPDLGKNTLAHLANSADNALFVGTTLGVFKYNDAYGVWERFSNNLPNVNVRDLEINPNDMIMTAGTYGRGVWQTAIDFVQPMNDISLKSAQGTGGTVDCGESDIEIALENTGMNTISQVTLSYSINEGTEVSVDYSVNIAPKNESKITIKDLNLQPGAYSIKLNVTTDQDEFLSNNFKSISLLQNSHAVVGESYEFEDDALVTLNDKSSSVLWERGMPNGRQLKNAASGKNVYATNLDGNYTDLTLAYLYTGCYDLKEVTDAEFSFDMAYDLEQDWDVFYVQYSIDKGTTWNLLGSSYEDNWYNSNRDSEGNNCFNCQGGQWTGTDTQMQNYKTSLKDLEGNSSVVFRFVFHSDQSINQEGVVLDNVMITGKSAQKSAKQDLLFSVYPNPSNGVFNIKWQMEAEYSYSVSDLTGKIILQSDNSNAKTSQMDLTGVATGMYFLKITSNGTSAAKKLIVR
ncbi:T9SS type A sorting domain-containing protein [Nonlabens marinus]|uniref:Glycosyl hydrolase, BNR repeat n=1 Tax=Nonlabens marinus S1-08 TaxID=1454201 RepID=W8VQD9_9FLAO|nr:T9SS type A sorting domain-containing protein [Nonlabens marinus]BAO55025.1 glycosyl hydrolase, BNR repeat precursor [Nonlabens marinus S1-08]